MKSWRIQPLDRQILALAIPALGALVAEPLFLLADSAMVGHLGQTALAGLGLAGVVLQTLVGLMVFLAYATTPAVARRLGQGDRQGAIAAGIDGLWFALVLGIALAIAGAWATPGLVAAFSTTPEVTAAAATYLRLSMPGIPAMLLVLAASGLLRGLQDTRTPLWVAAGGFAANIVLNYLLIYRMELGIAGSAIGTVLAQWGMVVAYLWVIGRHVKWAGVRLLPKRAGLKLGAVAGGWLFLRTLTMRVAMVLAVYAATALGPAQLAAFHIAMTLFATMAFALDALAIAAQALIGSSLGAGDTARTQAILRRCLQMGIAAGVVLGVLVMSSSPPGATGLAWLMAAFAFGFVGARLVTLGVRARGNAWMVTGTGHD